MSVIKILATWTSEPNARVTHPIVHLRLECWTNITEQQSRRRGNPQFNKHKTTAERSNRTTLDDNERLPNGKTRWHKPMTSDRQTGRDNNERPLSGQTGRHERDKRKEQVRRTGRGAILCPLHDLCPSLSWSETLVVVLMSPHGSRHQKRTVGLFCFSACPLDL